MDIRTLLAGLALVLVTSACGAFSPSPTPPGSPTPSPINHDVHAWPELEARLPDSISGRRLTKASLAAHPDRQDRKTIAVLTRLGRSVSDLQLANAELDGTDLLIGAMRVVGSDGGQIIDAFKAVDADDPNSPARYMEVSLGGKQVTARTVAGTSSYLYGTEDIMFIVSGERDLVEAALRQLPG